MPSTQQQTIIVGVVPTFSLLVLFLGWCVMPLGCSHQPILPSILRQSRNEERDEHTLTKTLQEVASPFLLAAECRHRPRAFLGFIKGLLCLCRWTLPERTIIIRQGDLEMGQWFASADQQATHTTPAPTNGVSAATIVDPTMTRNPSHIMRDPSTATLTSMSSDAAAPTTMQPDASTGIADATSLPVPNEWGRFPDGGCWYITPPSNRFGSYQLRVVALPERTTETVGQATQAPTVKPRLEPEAPWKDWMWSLWSALRGASRAEAG